MNPLKLALALAIASAPIFAAEAPGVPNFHEINNHLFRGAQPTEQGWNSLAKLGVKVVIDLRRENEDGHSTAAEAKAVQAAGMKYINVPMLGIVAPKDADVAKVLAIINGPDPVFVHCKKGKDRTGTVVAAYRIVHDRWTNQKAMDEAKDIGLHWIEIGMKSYINGYLAAPVVADAAAAGGSNP